jgi:hypothetical protein
MGSIFDKLVTSAMHFNDLSNPFATGHTPPCPKLRASVAAHKCDVASFNRQESAL